jgi:hypothetical protein
MSSGVHRGAVSAEKLGIAFTIRPTIWGGWLFAKPVFRDGAALAD